MLRKVIALAVAAGVLGASLPAYSQDRSREPAAAHKKVKAKPKVKKARHPASKSHQAKTIRRIDDAPDFRVTQTREQRMADARAAWERTQGERLRR